MPDLVLDGFAGPGGWSEGLRALGLRDIGLEWDTAACLTRAAAGHLTIQTDIAAYPTSPFKDRIRQQIWSPPCQAWSRAGKGDGLKDQPLVHQAVEDLAFGRDTRTQLKAACKDERSILAAEPMRWLHDLRPEWVCMEEVPDVLPLWRQYAVYLRGWGYSAWTGILNAADYGVPQTRKRAILIASRVRTVTAPEPTHAKDPEWDLFGDCPQPWVTMAEALGVAAGLTDGNRSWALRNGTQKNACTRHLDEPAGTLFFGARCNDVSWVLKSRRDSDTWIASNGPRENRRIDQPAPTFTGEAHRWSWAPDGTADSPDTIRITPDEAAVLQSFRPDYPWQGTKTRIFEQIGNAVPPLLAAHIVAAATGAQVPTTAHAHAA